MCVHGAVLVESQFTLDESIGELARVDRERADVTGYLFAVLVETTAKHHFEDPRPGPSGGQWINATR